MNGGPQTPHEAPVPDAVLEQAIAWLVRLQSGTADDGDRAACDAWRAAAAVHEAAWRQLQAVEQEFAAVPAASSRIALQVLAPRAKSPDRRRALKTLGLGAIGLAAASRLPWQRYGADYATARGEQRALTLADGTRLRLNTGSALDVAFTPARRLLVLRCGELLVETGADADAPQRRPFWVETAQARFEALGTRFFVREQDGLSRLHVTEGRVAAHGRDAGAPPDAGLVATPGQTVLVAARGAPALGGDDALDPGAWADGMLVARRMRLDEFVAELARYRSGWLRCDPAVAGLRVSGVFQLDHPEQILQALSRSLPVRVERRTDYWVTLRPA